MPDGYVLGMINGPEGGNFPVWTGTLDLTTQVVTWFASASIASVAGEVLSCFHAPSSEWCVMSTTPSTGSTFRIWTINGTTGALTRTLTLDIGAAGDGIYSPIRIGKWLVIVRAQGFGGGVPYFQAMQLDNSHIQVAHVSGVEQGNVSPSSVLQFGSHLYYFFPNMVMWVNLAASARVPVLVQLPGRPNINFLPFRDINSGPYVSYDGTYVFIADHGVQPGSGGGLYAWLRSDPNPANWGYQGELLSGLLLVGQSPPGESPFIEDHIYGTHVDSRNGHTVAACGRFLTGPFGATLNRGIIVRLDGLSVVGTPLRNQFLWEGSSSSFRRPSTCVINGSGPSVQCYQGNAYLTLDASGVLLSLKAPPAAFPGGAASFITQNGIYLT